MSEITTKPTDNATARAVSMICYLRTIISETMIDADLAAMDEAILGLERAERERVELLKAMEVLVAWDMRRNVRPYVGGLDRLLADARALVARVKAEPT